MPHELPVLFTKDVCADPARLAKALQQAFDTIGGDASHTQGRILEAFDYADKAAEDAVETSNPRDEALREFLEDAGEGTPDGQPPASSPVPRAYSILGALYILFDTIANTSTVTFDIHVSTTNGFTPAANTKVVSLIFAGRTGGTGSHIVRNFPTGHFLAGQQPNPAVTYYVRTVASDVDGSAAPSAQVTATSEMINAANKAIYLGANIIEGDMIVGNAIDGKTITGATIISPNAIGGTWRVEIGGASGWPIRYWNGSQVNFALRADGSAAFRGELLAASGTFSGIITGGEIIGADIRTGDSGINAKLGIDTIGPNTIGGLFLRNGLSVQGSVYYNSGQDEVVLDSTRKTAIVSSGGDLRLFTTGSVRVVGGPLNLGGQNLNAAGAASFGGIVTFDVRPDFTLTGAAIGGANFGANEGTILIRVGGVNKRIPYWS
jgi:hypothetical protein